MSPVCMKHSVEQPIGTCALWNYLWLTEKCASQSEYRAKERGKGLVFFQTNWITISSKISRNFCPIHQKYTAYPSFKCSLFVGSVVSEIKSNCVSLQSTVKHFLNRSSALTTVAADGPEGQVCPSVSWSLDMSPCKKKKKTCKHVLVSVCFSHISFYKVKWPSVSMQLYNAVHLKWVKKQRKAERRAREKIEEWTTVTW